MKMGNKMWDRFLIIFHVMVWTLTILSVAYCLKIYYLNEDLCIVEYKKYYEEKSDRFPRLSLCFRDPIMEPKLKEYDSAMTKDMYIKYLTGDYYNETYSKIDYFDTLLKLSDHIQEYSVEWRSGHTTYFNITHNETQKVFIPTYAITWDSHFYQCYELQVPDNENISSFFAVVDSSLFPPRDKALHYDLLTFLHYPNQLLISGKNVKFSWPERGSNDNFIMRFRIDGVEIVKIRERTDRVCDKLEDYDTDVMLKHVQSIGCRAPYHKNNDDLKICTEKELMKNVSWAMKKKDYHIDPPCNSMKMIVYNYEESSMNGTEFSREGFVWVGVYFHDEQFKEISQTRSIDLQEVIGSIGGYIGALLGYSILQIPEMITIVMSKIKLAVQMMRINRKSKKKLDNTQFKFQDTTGNNAVKTMEVGIKRIKVEEKDRNVSVKENMKLDEIIGRLRKLEDHIEEMTNCSKKCQKFD